MPLKTLLRGPTKRQVAAVALAVALATAACSTKSENEGGASATATGAVKTGVGITGNTINLGALTDITGLFAASGKEITLGQRIYWDLENAKGGVCGKFKVKTQVEDHGYSPQTATTKYAGMKDDILSLEQLLGSPPAVALSPDIEADKIVAMPLSWARNIAENPYYAIVGPTYDVEIINGLDYLLEKGVISKGAKIGHIYHDSEYGMNALDGVKFFAKRNDMTVVEQKIPATDLNLDSKVTALKAQGVNLIVVTTSHVQASKIAEATVKEKLDVPLLGSGPTFVPSLLDTTARDVLVDRFYLAAPNASPGSKAAKALYDKYKKDNPGGKPASTLVTGYTAALVLDTILEKACADGDLTREGVFRAKQSLTSIDTGGLTGVLDYSKPGISPSKQSFIFRPDPASPGGVKPVAELYEGTNATAFAGK
jgi:ABC-type branched-subunit amino acid transport system substrate-binding protein